MAMWVWLCRCTGSSKPLLVVYVIRTIISQAGSFKSDQSLLFCVKKPWIPRLTSIFTGHTVILLVLSCGSFHQCTLSYPLRACSKGHDQNDWLPRLTLLHTCVIFLVLSCYGSFHQKQRDQRVPWHKNTFSLPMTGAHFDSCSLQH